jgi:hypothetical protein
MGKIFINFIVKPFVFLLILILILVTTGLIYDSTREGTHFTRSVTASKDAKLLQSDYWGFIDGTIRFHFTAPPEVMNSIISLDELKPVDGKDLNIFGLPEIKDWTSNPGEVSSYSYSELVSGFEHTVIVLQHNQEKSEAFYFIDSY